MSIIAGIDEAGRGPVLGVLAMAVVACTPEQKKTLQELGVKDSKLLSVKKRDELYKYIKKNLPHAIIKVKPEEIDKHVRSQKSSLNRLEAITSGKLIKKICKQTSVSKVILDLPSKNKQAYIDDVRSKLPFPENAISIIAEFKADLNYIEVGAASILAKVTRDRIIKNYEKKLGFKIGSGYPSDVATIKSLYQNYKILDKEKIIRTSWKTSKIYLEKKSQKRLGEF